MPSIHREFPPIFEYSSLAATFFLATIPSWDICRIIQLCKSVDILSAPQIVDLIKKATSDSNEQGNPSLTLHVTNATEAESAISRLRSLKTNLKLIKRRISHIQSQIRAENSGNFRSLFIADLLEKNFGRRFEEGDVAGKKRTLISLYKEASLMIDDLVIQIDENIPMLEDYIIRNR